MTTQPPPYGRQPQGFGLRPQGFGLRPQYTQPAPSGPEFLAVDIHNSIVVDVEGVTFEDPT